MADFEAPDIEDWLQLGVTVLSLLVFVVGFLAWRRRPTPRTRLVLVALGVFALRSVFLVVDFVSQDLASIVEPIAVVADLAFLALLLLAAWQN